MTSIVGKKEEAREGGKRKHRADPDSTRNGWAFQRWLSLPQEVKTCVVKSQTSFLWGILNVPVCCFLGVGIGYYGEEGCAVGTSLISGVGFSSFSLAWLISR